MTARSAHCSNRRDRGLTLVEVLLGTALLGSVLVGLVLASSALNAQSARAAWRGRACRVADELIGRWWVRREQFPRSGQGPVPDRPGWRWRCSVVERPGAELLGGEVVAVEVFCPDRRLNEPAARVEVLLAVKERR